MNQDEEIVGLKASSQVDPANHIHAVVNIFLLMN